MQWGLCFVDDLIEHTGPQSWALKDFFLPSFLRGVMHQQNDIKQTAVYGVGIAAMTGGPEYTAALAEFVPLLIQIIEANDSRSDDNNICTENAISAMTKVCDDHLPHRVLLIQVFEATKLNENLVVFS